METLNCRWSWLAWPAWETEDVLLVAMFGAWVVASWWNHLPDIRRLRRERRRRLAGEAVAAEAVAAEAGAERALAEQTIAAETKSSNRA